MSLQVRLDRWFVTIVNVLTSQCQQAQWSSCFAWTMKTRKVFIYFHIGPYDPTLQKDMCAVKLWFILLLTNRWFWCCCGSTSSCRWWHCSLTVLSSDSCTQTSYHWNRNGSSGTITANQVTVNEWLTVNEGFTVKYGGIFRGVRTNSQLDDKDKRKKTYSLVIHSSRLSCISVYLEAVLSSVLDIRTRSSIWNVSPSR